MRMPMSKPPTIESRLYCSPSYSQSIIVSNKREKGDRSILFITDREYCG